MRPPTAPRIGIWSSSPISFAAQLQANIAVRTSSGPFTLDLRTGRLQRGGLVPFASDTLTVTD